MQKSPPPLSGFSCCPFQSSGSVIVIDSLFIAAPIVCGRFVFGTYYVMQSLVSFKFLVLQSSAEAKRAGCFTLIVCLKFCLFFTVPWVGMQFVIMVLPVHTYFKKKKVVYNKKSCSTEHEISTAHQN